MSLSLMRNEEVTVLIVSNTLPETEVESPGPDEHLLPFLVPCTLPPSTQETASPCNPSDVLCFLMGPRQSSPHQAGICPRHVTIIPSPFLLKPKQF